MKLYWINSSDRTVTSADQNGLKDLQRLVGGNIEIAKFWPNNDVLFADEEGLYKGTNTWFLIAGINQPICGNAVVVGSDDQGETTKPRATLEQIAAEVRFLTDEQVRSWAKANASDPASSFSFFNADGTVTTKILATTGQIFDVEPGSK